MFAHFFLALVRHSNNGGCRSRLNQFIYPNSCCCSIHPLLHIFRYNPTQSLRATKNWASHRSKLIKLYTYLQPTLHIREMVRYITLFSPGPMCSWAPKNAGFPLLLSAACPYSDRPAGKRRILTLEPGSWIHPPIKTAGSWLRSSRYFLY